MKTAIKNYLRPLALLAASAVTLAGLPFDRASVASRAQAQARRPLLIAHRGASGYAPEHTIAAYEMAVEQGADFVEQDLQLTKDGALVCLHDADLARTTNVEEVFPDRATLRDVEGKGAPKRGWYAIDFTLAEIKRLDAGSWFNSANPFAASPAYVNQRVPTLEEAIIAVGKRAGLYIEMKYYEFYKSAGQDIAGKLADALRARSFSDARRRDRVLIQSFSKASLLRMRELAPVFALVQLLPMTDRGREDSNRVTRELAKEIAAYASGVGPGKSMISSESDVRVFHEEGLIVHPYTFRGPTTATTRRPLDELLRRSIIDEIKRFLSYRIDGGFTDYPQVWRQAEQ